MSVLVVSYVVCVVEDSLGELLFVCMMCSVVLIMVGESFLVGVVLVL